MVAWEQSHVLRLATRSDDSPADECRSRPRIGGVKRLAALFVGVVLAAAAPAAAHAAPTAPAARTGASPCTPGTPDTAPATTAFYDPAQPAMGPAVLPRSAPVRPLLLGYHRFGALSEAQFIAKYRTGAGWIYPPSDGFLTIGGFVLRDELTLKPGRRVDRFGYPGGAYLAPLHTLFLRRALPPQNLTTPAGTPQSNYHVYCVLKAFDVDGGPIAPWFEQLGLGLQYKISHVPVGDAAPSVSWLITNGYLVEERPA